MPIPAPGATLNVRVWNTFKYCADQLLVLVEDGHMLQTGYTALHLAASRGHLEVVRALLAASRSVNSQDKIVCIFLL